MSELPEFSDLPVSEFYFLKSHTPPLDDYNYEWWLQKNRAWGSHDTLRYHLVICIEGLRTLIRSLRKTVKMNIWNGHLLNMKIRIWQCNIPYIKNITFLLFYSTNSYFSVITKWLNKNLRRHANNHKLSSLSCNLFKSASYHSIANNKCKLKREQ
jgi:hypothetical protein